MSRLCLYLLICLSVFSQSALAAVLAIDYGADWIKASLMAPGVPFDVLLNKDSKRKMQATVGWKREDRLFGSDASNVAGRFPTDSFSSLKYLQAAPYDSNTVSYFMSISTAELLETSRGTVAVRRPDGSEWAVEELVAMQFAYVRELAEHQLNGERVTDVVITVPPFYTQHERDAVIDAAEIAGMKTLALVHDGSAVAVNYAMTRTFSETPEYHIIYDAGASSIRATVVSLKSVSDGSKTKSTGTQITVAGIGYDRQVGGTELDRRLREILINDFKKRYKKDIRTDRRGMAKLWKEAGRVKAILSANAEASSSVESLAFDIDYRSKVKRSEFESACADLKPRYARPILDALENAGLTLDDISSVILTGGASRTPMIQAAVKGTVGESKISLNVNADEAAVLGAGLYGAGLSRQFKTKDIRISDIGSYDMAISYQSEGKSQATKPRTINTAVFSVGSKLGTKKSLSFRRKEDFAVKFSYKSQPVHGYPTDIITVDIFGVTEALQNLTDRGAIDPIVKATVSLSDSGFVTVHDVVAFGEIKDESIAGKLKGLFGNSASPDEENASDDEPAAREESTSSSAPAASPSPAKKKEDTIPLEFKINLSSIPPMSVAEKRTARDRLAAINKQETAKRRREEARNTLEGYVYRLRDLLEEDATSPFMKCSQERERESISEKVSEVYSWLHEDGEDAETDQYLSRRSSLEALERPIVHRYKEIEDFPHALNDSQRWNWSTRLFITEARQNLTEAEKGGLPSKYTHEELEALEKTLIDHEKWLNQMVEKQKRVKMNEDPVLETSELRAKVKPLENHLQRLVRKKMPRPKKPVKASTSSSSSSAESTTSASAGGDPKRHVEL